MSKKRILVVSQHFWPETFRINDIVQGFMEDSIEVDVLCGLPNYPKGEWFSGYRYTGPRREEYFGAGVYRAGEIPRKGNTSLRIFLNYVSWPFFALFSLPRLRGKRYDAVFCYNTSPVLMCLPAILYAKLHKVPLTTYVLDLWPDNLYSVLPVENPLLRGVASGVSNWIYRRSTRLIALSEPLREKLVKATGKSRDEIAVIPQYCEDFYATHTADAELQAQFGGRFNLVFAGNFSPAQNLETVIDAAVLAKNAGAENLHLLLVGDGMSKDALLALRDKHGAQSYITFYGSVPPQKIPAFQFLADGLVAPLSASANLGETVPAKIASYMAGAKPILASIDGEGARAVQRAKCGFATPAGDVQALADAMLALYNTEPATRAEMGANAFTFYKENYTRKENLESLERFLLKD